MNKFSEEFDKQVRKTLSQPNFHEKLSEALTEEDWEDRDDWGFFQVEEDHEDTNLLANE